MGPSSHWVHYWSYRRGRPPRVALPVVWVSMRWLCLRVPHRQGAVAVVVVVSRIPSCFNIQKLWGFGKSASSSSVCRKLFKQANLVTSLCYGQVFDILHFRLKLFGLSLSLKHVCVCQFKLWLVKLTHKQCRRCIEPFTMHHVAFTSIRSVLMFDQISVYIYMFAWCRLQQLATRRVQRVLIHRRAVTRQGPLALKNSTSIHHPKCRYLDTKYNLHPWTNH